MILGAILTILVGSTAMISNVDTIHALSFDSDAWTLIRLMH